MYYKESTEETTIVSLNPEKGVLLIDGNCESETPEEFFTNITDWIITTKETARNHNSNYKFGGIFPLQNIYSILFISLKLFIKKILK